MSAQLHYGQHGPLLSSLGMKHFNEQVVAGHVAVQVFVVKVFFSLQADGSDLWQPEEQLAKLVCLLWVVTHDIVQQRCVDLLLDTLYQVEVLQVLHIYRSQQIKRLDEMTYNKQALWGLLRIIGIKKWTIITGLKHIKVLAKNYKPPCRTPPLIDFQKTTFVQINIIQSTWLDCVHIQSYIKARCTGQPFEHQLPSCLILTESSSWQKLYFKTVAFVLMETNTWFIMVNISKTKMLE